MINFWIVYSGISSALDPLVYELNGNVVNLATVSNGPPLQTLGRIIDVPPFTDTFCIVTLPKDTGENYLCADTFCFPNPCTYSPKMGGSQPEQTISITKGDQGEKFILSIFPNPSSSSVQVTMNESLAENTKRIRVYDLAGKVVLEKQGDTASQIIDFSNHPNGVYLISCINDKGKHIASDQVIIRH